MDSRQLSDRWATFPAIPAIASDCAYTLRTIRCCPCIILLLRTPYRITRDPPLAGTTTLSTSSTLLIRVIWGFALQPPGYFAQSALAAVCSSLSSWSEPVWFARKRRFIFCGSFVCFIVCGAVSGWLGGMIVFFVLGSNHLDFCFLRLAGLSKSERIEPMMATPVPSATQGAQV